MESLILIAAIVVFLYVIFKIVKDVIAIILLILGIAFLLGYFQFSGAPLLTLNLSHIKIEKIGEINGHTILKITNEGNFPAKISNIEVDGKTVKYEATKPIINPRESSIVEIYASNPKTIVVTYNYFMKASLINNK